MKLPRLNLRDLFWLLLVVACLCGWWADRNAMFRKQADLSDRLARLVAEVNRLQLEVFQKDMQLQYHQQ
jgi:hypothetical protein